jgi:mycothiol synthase
MYTPRDKPADGPDHRWSTLLDTEADRNATNASIRRAYRDDDDFLRMRRFLQAGWQVTGPDGGLLSVGDLTWKRFMYTREVERPEDVFGLWDGPDGELVGFTIYYAKWREVSLQIDPRLRGTAAWAETADDMLAWADERHEVSGADGSTLTVYERESDGMFAAFIQVRGFARTDDPPMRFHRQSLARPAPEPVLPEGFEVRAVREEELEQRVEIHREVWHPSKVTLESYRQLRAAPGYDPELDIVAVAPDGTIGAYAICWHDEVNRSGLFEPVGAREAFRGRGLAKAVLLESMRRLRERGCEMVYVYTTEDREAACRLYLSAGFEVIDRWLAYRRADGSTGLETPC